MNRYNLLGGKLEKRRVNDFSEVPEKFQLVVNCTGLSSGELCNDPEVWK